MTHCFTPRPVKAEIIFESWPTLSQTISSTSGARAGSVSFSKATATRRLTPAARAWRANTSGSERLPAMRPRDASAVFIAMSGHSITNGREDASLRFDRFPALKPMVSSEENVKGAHPGNTILRLREIRLEFRLQAVSANCHTWPRKRGTPNGGASKMRPHEIAPERQPRKTCEKSI